MHGLHMRLKSPPVFRLQLEDIDTIVS